MELYRRVCFLWCIVLENGRPRRQFISYLTLFFSRWFSDGTLVCYTSLSEVLQGRLWNESRANVCYWEQQ